MAGSYRTFQARVRRRGDTFRGNTQRLLRNTAISALENLVRDTPVDTGLARSNWTPQLTASTPPVRRIATEEGAIASGTFAIKAISGDTIHIINPLPYIEFLNSGSSPQAPAGYIEMALNKAQLEQLGSGSLLAVGYRER